MIGASPTPAKPGQIDWSQMPTGAARRVLEPKTESHRRVAGVDHDHEP